MRTKILAAAVAVLVSGSAMAASASTIDVDNLVLAPQGTTNWGGLDAGTSLNDVLYQTWTVGLGGSLDRIDMVSGISGQSPFDLTLSIYRGTTPDQPGALFAGSVTKHSTELPALGLTTFDLTSLGISAAAGDVLTWKVNVTACPIGGCNYIWVNATQFAQGALTTPQYAGGKAFTTNANIPLIQQYDDANFRTWMTAPGSSAVPEPQSWALMILGFGATGALLRRRRIALAA